MEKLKYIDTHAHYYHPKFNKNSEQLLSKIYEDVSHIINLGTDVNSNKETVKLINDFDFMWGMVGFFPTSTYMLEDSMNPNADKVISTFKEQLNHSKIIGVGEIGLDYHWDCVGKKGAEIRGEDARKIQRKWLEIQIDIAKEMGLPVSMHSRDAEEDTLNIFNKYKSILGVMHCFSYGLKSAKEYLNKGLYLGIGGTCTYPNSNELRDVIKYAPLERLLLETDAPYLSPQQVRRELNTSLNIKYVIEEIARLKQISEEDVIIQTNKNAFKLFGME